MRGNKTKNGKVCSNAAWMAVIRTEDQTDVLYITYINRMTSNQKGNKNNVASKRDTMRKEQFPARKTEGSPRKRISRVCLQYSTLSPQKNRKFGRGKYVETSKTSGCAPRNSKKAWKKKNSRTILRLPFFFAIKTFDFDKWK